MVLYQPPDRVLLMIGACFRSEPMILAARRLAPLVERDQASLFKLGVPAESAASLEKHAKTVASFLSDPEVQKNDTPLQMREVAEIRAKIREFLKELRERASINLLLDEPALLRVFSPSPELNDVYPRDLLTELEARLRAAQDLVPRLRDVGVDRKFADRGKLLAQQLRTAIGVQDLAEDNVKPKAKRLYLRKAQLIRLEQHVVRAGQVIFRGQPERRRAYHLSEIDLDL